jgi:hypothetical protein
VSRRRPRRHPSEARHSVTPCERESLTIPDEVWARIRPGRADEERRAARRRAVRVTLSAVIFAALLAMSVAVPAGLTYAPLSGWVVSILSSAVVGCATATAFVLSAWVHRRWS